MYTINLKSELVKKINDHEIYRSETRIYNEYTDKFVGKKQVFYDVYCKDGGDIIESHKSLREAIKFAKSL